VETLPSGLWICKEPHQVQKSAIIQVVRLVQDLDVQAAKQRQHRWYISDTGRAISERPEDGIDPATLRSREVSRKLLKVDVLGPNAVTTNSST
jgi:hypothetical protein